MDKIYSIQDLPREVMSTIFGFIEGKHDLAQIALVCRSWNELVQPFLYKTVSLNFCLDFGGEILDDDFDPDDGGNECKQVKNIVKRPELAKYVKKMIISAGGDIQVPEFIGSNHLVFENLDTLQIAQLDNLQVQKFLSNNKAFYLNLSLYVGSFPYESLLDIEPPVLNTLHLQGSKYDIGPIGTLPEFLQNQIDLRKKKDQEDLTLDTLTIVQCNMGPEFCSTLVKCIPLLATLKLRSFILRDGLESVQNCEISDSLVACLLNDIPTLEELKLVGVMGFSPSVIGECRDSLFRLTKFDLLMYAELPRECANMLMQSIKVLLQNNNRLERLSVTVQDAYNVPLDEAFYDVETFKNVQNSLEYIKFHMGDVKMAKLWPVLGSLAYLRHIRVQER